MYFNGCVHIDNEICKKGVRPIKVIVVAFYKLKMMLSDKLLFAAMILIPLLIMVTAGYTLKNEKLDTIPVAVVDEDESAYSSLLLERLSRKEGLSLNTVDRKRARDLLEASQIEQVFIINKGFEKSVKRGESDGLIEIISSSSSYSAGYTAELVAGETIRMVTADMASNNVVQHYESLGMEKGSGFRDEVYAFVDALWEPEPLMTIDYKELRGGVVEEVSRAVPSTSSAASAGLIVAFIMFYMLFAGCWLIEERLNGTIKRLAVGSGAVAASFFGSVLALFAAGALQIFIFAAVLRLFFGITLFAGALSYLVLFAYLLAVIAISMLLSSVLKTQAQLQAGAPVLALLTGFAGGCFWNFIELPERVEHLSMFTPQGWALKALNSLITEPTALSMAMIPLLILLAISLILLPASYIIVNMQLRRG